MFCTCRFIGGSIGCLHSHGCFGDFFLLELHLRNILALSSRIMLCWNRNEGSGFDNVCNEMSMVPCVQFLVIVMLFPFEF